MAKRLKNESFGEIGANRGIRHHKKRLFRTQNDPFSMQNASYRKRSTYTKSIKCYKLERERRRQVRLLTQKGLTQKQIAKELDVSVRTIKRDWSKLQPYLLSQLQKEMRQATAEKNRQFEILTLKEQVKLLQQETTKIIRLKKVPTQNQILRRLEQVEAKLNINNQNSSQPQVRTDNDVHDKLKG